MKISTIFVFLTFSVVVKGWAAVLQPFVMSIGAVLAAFNIDLDLISDIQPFIWKSEEKKTEEQEMEEYNQALGAFKGLIDENQELINNLKDKVFTEAEKK